MSLTAYQWKLARDDDSVCFVLVGPIVIAVQFTVIIPSLHWNRTTSSWTYSTAKDARETALDETRKWEDAGYALYGSVRAAQVEVVPFDLSQECLTLPGVGPILDSILETLDLHGAVLDA